MADIATNDPELRRLIDQVFAARDAGTALEIRGGATKRFYGNEPRGQEMDLRALAGISSYEPSELVATVRAGTPLAELEAALAEQGQCLPFEPPRFAPGGTVGGMVAAGLSGPARAAVGSVRDYVLGATILDGQGRVLTFGGQVMKNVAGYDVSRSMAGSMGVLGVILEVSLKVLPLPPATATLAFDCDQADALRRLSGWTSQPLPINASFWHGGRLWLRLSGAQAAVESAVQRLGGESVPAEVAAALWRSVRDQDHAYFAPGSGLWRLSLPALTPVLPLAGEVAFEWGGAQRWLRSDADPAAVRAAATGAGGHATQMRGPDRSEVFTRPAEPLMRIQRELKRAFDPHGLFNPGRLYSDL
ncbi:MAG: hypothetical protein RJA36_2798 [Pseudomonadota bacterium]|jgi:FAD/FMN-containing dehydrogenase